MSEYPKRIWGDRMLSRTLSKEACRKLNIMAVRAYVGQSGIWPKDEDMEQMGITRQDVIDWDK